MRQSLFRDGEYYDEYIMSMLKRNFTRNMEGDRQEFKVSGETNS
ncbi:hypothetical protein [Thermoanaerobacter uzonensis]|nr:hypothetical protein [Thermoanaerobacter uzonensis]